MYLVLCCKGQRIEIIGFYANPVQATYRANAVGGKRFRIGPYVHRHICTWLSSVGVPILECEDTCDLIFSRIETCL